MKKALAILLALLMLASVAFVACENNGGNTNDDDWDNENDYVDTGDDSDSDSSDDSDSTDTDNKGNNTTVTGWIDKNDTVYVGSKMLNLRTSTSSASDSNIAKTANGGDTLTRISTNGTWDKVKVSGDTTEYYVQSKFICTNPSNFNFTDLAEDDYVTITYVKSSGKSLCLYSTPFQIKENGALLYNNISYVINDQPTTDGGKITKIGTSANGWLKVTVEGTFGTTDGKTPNIAKGTYYIDPNSALSDRINDPSRPTGGGNTGADG